MFEIISDLTISSAIDTFPPTHKWTQSGPFMELKEQIRCNFSCFYVWLLTLLYYFCFCFGIQSRNFFCFSLFNMQFSLKSEFSPRNIFIHLCFLCRVLRPVIECCLGAFCSNVRAFLQTTHPPQYNPHHQLSELKTQFSGDNFIKKWWRFVAYDWDF